ncbi:MAG: cupin domain-containing protein [Chloroflexota bacterium]
MTATPMLGRKSTYAQFVASEGIPLIEGSYIPDLKTVEVQPWARRDAKGVYINHDASDISNDCYVMEIPPGKECAPQHQLFEEMIYVLSGRGATTVWMDDGKKHHFEWGPGALFGIPLNAWHQHFNASGSEPVRYLGVTSAPVSINTFADWDFVFNCDYKFLNRFTGEDDYFSGKGTQTGMVWETNFVANVPDYALLDYKARGAGGRNIKFTLCRNQMGAHVSEFPVGTYKKGHRHGPGAHVVVIGGEGYSLMWKQGEEIKKYDWHVGSLVIPPDRTFHQHFNVGASPARYLALRFSGNTEMLTYDPNNLPMGQRSVSIGGDQFEYDEQDAYIHETFVTECAKHGVEVKMKEFLPAGKA